MNEDFTAPKEYGISLFINMQKHAVFTQGAKYGKLYLKPEGITNKETGVEKLKMRSMTSTSYIARTGILLALALIFQVGFRSFAQPLVGPLVNMTLIMSVLSVGVASGLTIGCFTPLIAFFMGIMPLFPLVPIIMAGNAIFVSTFAFIRDRTSGMGEYIALAVAALFKFAFLAVSVRKLLVLFIPKVPPGIVAAFSLPQLYTALAGGIIAIVLHKMIKNNY